MVTLGSPFAGSDPNQIWPFLLLLTAKIIGSPPSAAAGAKPPGTAPCMPLPGVVPGPLRPVGAGPTPAPGAVGGEPFAVFSCCVGPVGAQNPI